MELKDENRILVKCGLERMRHTKNTGLKALIEVCGLEGKELSAYHIGFIVFGKTFFAGSHFFIHMIPFDGTSGRILGKNRNVGKYQITDGSGNYYDMVYFGDLEGSSCASCSTSGFVR